MILAPQQDMALKEVDKWFKNMAVVKPFFYLAGYAGTGKALSKESILQTPNGPIKMGNVKIGDVIFGKNGKETTVTGVFPQGIRPAYKITFRDNFSVICDEDHLWKVTKSTDKKNKYRVLTTKEIVEIGFKRPSGDSKFKIPLCDPVEYEKKIFKIHPYNLGVFLGDGSISKDKIYITIGNKDSDIADLFFENHEGNYTKNIKSGCYSYYISKSKELREEFSRLNINVKSKEKFIPREYLLGSIEQRYDLLKGLMDTDGSIRNNRTTFSTFAKGLAYDIAELVQSLGGTAIILEYDRSHEGKHVEYSVNIKTFENPFKVESKSSKWRFSAKNPPSRYIKNIEKIADCDMQCISVSAKDKLFLTDHYVVTHNTTLAKHFAEAIDGMVLYAAYTGKASLVMRKNGCIGASTTHSLLYIPKVNPKTGLVTYQYNPKSIITKAKLVIIDECSMIDSKMGMDLLSFGVPILVLGDPAQLPPVAGAGFFTSHKPDFMLTEIHRQANDNPIIYLATKVRNKEKLEVGIYGNSKVTKKFLKDEVFKADQLLCGLNVSRNTMNDIFRKELGCEGLMPVQGETLICLKNNHDLGIFNGEMFKVLDNKQNEKSMVMNLSSMDEDNKHINAKVLNYMFNPEFKEPENWRDKKGYSEMAYGYCLTTHKSQGSQWEDMYVIDESSVFRGDWWRWLYTGITRASNKTIIYQGD